MGGSRKVGRTALLLYCRLRYALRGGAGGRRVTSVQEFADPATLLSDGDEIAFLPPVSGGSDLEPVEIESAGNYFALTRFPIDTRASSRRCEKQTCKRTRKSLRASSNVN